MTTYPIQYLQYETEYLENSIKKLQENSSRDEFIIYFLKCNHISDTLITCGHVEKLVNDFVRNSKVLSLLRDLVNTIKHKKPRGEISYGGGYELITRHVDHFDGSKIKTCIQEKNKAFPTDAIVLAKESLEEWRKFIKLNPLQ